QNLRGGRPSSGETTDLCRDRRDRRRAAERRPLLWRRDADFIGNSDFEDRTGAIYREHPFGQGAGCDGEVLLSSGQYPVPSKTWASLVAPASCSPVAWRRFLSLFSPINSEDNNRLVRWGYPP